MESTEITSGDIAAAAEAASASASPAAQPQSTETADPTTTASAAAPETAAEDHGPKPVPYPDHKRVVDGYHERLRELSWAAEHKREEVEEALAIRRELQRRQSEGNAPQPDVKDERGEMFYSPQQAAKLARWEAQQAASELRRELAERFSPIEQSFERQQRTEAIITDHDRVMSMPGSKEHEAAMAQWIYEINERRANGEPLRKPTAMDAYLAVVPSALAKAGDLTSRIAEEKKKWAAELNTTTTRVQRDVKPGSEPASSRKKDSDKSWAEALEDAAERARVGA